MLIGTDEENIKMYIKETGCEDVKLIHELL
jgi:hypothetical protein